MFCAYSKDKKALADFIFYFKKNCEDNPNHLILDSNRRYVFGKKA